LHTQTCWGKNGNNFFKNCHENNITPETYIDTTTWSHNFWRSYFHFCLNKFACATPTVQFTYLLNTVNLDGVNFLEWLLFFYLELLTLPEHMSSPRFLWDLFYLIFNCMCMFWTSLVVLFSFDHCVFCSSWSYFHFCLNKFACATPTVHFKWEFVAAFWLCHLWKIDRLSNWYNKTLILSFLYQIRLCFSWHIPEA
jgi:hypothetical protein